MKNKFEALAAFQSWPKEWQQLCAEFWAEGDMDVPVVLQEGGARFTSRAEPSLPAIGDPFPHSDPQPQRAAKVTKRRSCKKRLKWTAAEQEYLISCRDRSSTKVAAAKLFLNRYPERLATCNDAIKAVTIQIDSMTDANGDMHVRYQC